MLVGFGWNIEYNCVVVMTQPLNMATTLGWVVQRWDNFNPGLSKTYSTNCFSEEKITVHT